MSQRVCLCLTAVALCCCLGCGSSGTTSEKEIILPEDSREAAEYCRKLGGHVVTDVVSIEFLLESDTSNAASSAADPASKVDDATLARLAGLTRLRSLRLVGTNITDAGLAHLKGLERLETLELSNSTGITDAGLEHLKEIRSLRVLIIRGCGGITPAGREELRAFFKEKYKVPQLLVTGP